MDRPICGDLLPCIGTLSMAGVGVLKHIFGKCILTSVELEALCKLDCREPPYICAAQFWTWVSRKMQHAYAWARFSVAAVVLCLFRCLFCLFRAVYVSSTKRRLFLLLRSCPNILPMHINMHQSAQFHGYHNLSLCLLSCLFC